MGGRLRHSVFVLLAVGLFGTAAWGIDKFPRIPAGSTLRVKLDTTLTDKTNKSGDPFTGEVTEPISLNGQEVIPAGSIVNGHVAFVKPSGRIKGKAQMRIVVDKVVTPDNVVYPLASTLEDTQGAVCGKTTVSGKANEEGTITGCGKSKKDAAKGAAIAGAMGASGGATVGMGHEIDCRYFGNCGGPGFGADIGYGAALGATTALVYTLFQHEKHIVLVEGTQLTFVVNRTTSADEMPAAEAAPSPAEDQ